MNVSQMQSIPTIPIIHTTVNHSYVPHGYNMITFHDGQHCLVSDFMVSATHFVLEFHARTQSLEVLQASREVSNVFLIMFCFYISDLFNSRYVVITFQEVLLLLVLWKHLSSQ